MTKAAIVAFVLVAAGAILVGTGVSPGELGLFVLFELGFVLLPGVVAYRALASKPGDLLQQISLGAAVGHALLLAAFVVTAALGARGALWLLPVAGLIGAGLLWRRRGEATRPAPAFSNSQAIALAGVALAALGLLAFAFFTQAPIPGSRASVSYYQDLVWAMGIAAEALHHWPITTPDVAGESMRYHTFAFMDIAAVTQQTGVELPVVSLRLFPASLLLLLVLQLAWAGRRFTGNAWAGPVAAGLVLLVGDLDLGAGRPEPLTGLYFSSLYLSASQLLGMVLFLASIGVVADVLEAEGRRPDARTLGLLAILLFGCAGAKASLLPVLIGGLLVAALWRRRVTAPWAAALALCAVAFLSSYVLLYSGGTRGSTLDPFRSALLTLPGQDLDLELAQGFPRAVGYPIAIWVSVVALLAPLAALALVRVRLRSPSASQAWLLGLFAASLGAFFLIDLPGFSQLYFLWFGYTAAALLAAGAIVEVAAEWRANPPRGARWTVAGAVVVGCIIALAATGNGAGTPWVFMAVAALLGLIAVASGPGLLRSERVALPAVFAVVALLTAGLLDAPRDRLPDIASRALSGDQTVHRQANPSRERGLTAALADGLEWVRDKTDEDSVLAVNNHLRRPAIRESRYYYYSGLAERRIFVGSWDYTDRALGADAAVKANPFPERLALNDSVYAAGGRGAAAELRRRGVAYVLVDRANGPIPPQGVDGKLVFRNAALDVYRL